jgi:hypothetical protein
LAGKADLDDDHFPFILNIHDTRVPSSECKLQSPCCEKESFEPCVKFTFYDCVKLKLRLVHADIGDTDMRVLVVDDFDRQIDIRRSTGAHNSHDLGQCPGDSNEQLNSGISFNPRDAVAMNRRSLFLATPKDKLPDFIGRHLSQTVVTV